MLNIGEFARFAGVSVRMLRHYDSLGLLVPTSVDPTSSYRRYAESLIPRAHQLVALKELGFSLDEVGTLLADTLSAGQFRELLEERRRTLADQIAADSERLSEVERRLRLIEGVPMSHLVFEEKDLPTLHVLARTATVEDHDQIGSTIGPMFEGLAQQLIDNGEVPGHPGVAWYEGQDGRLAIGAGYVNKTAAPDGAAFHDLPAVPRALTAIYRGSMTGIGQAWQELAAEVGKRGLDMTGPCREIYLNTQGPQEEWVTELQQPVG